VQEVVQPKRNSGKKIVQKMEPSPFTRLQAKMVRCLNQEKEQKGGGFPLVFLA